MTYVEFNLIRVISAGIITAAISAAYCSFAHLLHGPLLNMQLNMDSSRAEVSYLRLMTEDADSFDKVAELYFEARDTDDEKAYDSPWEDHSSESGEESNEEEKLFCITSLESDLSEKAKVTAFTTTTCNCKFGEGEKPCSASLSLDEFVKSRNNCHELTSTT